MSGTKGCFTQTWYVYAERRVIDYYMTSYVRRLEGRLGKVLICPPGRGTFTTFASTDVLRYRRL